MTALHGDQPPRPERFSVEPESKSDVQRPLDEPALFCSHEDRLHDGMLVGFMVLMLLGALIGLLTTLVDLLALLD